MQQTRLPETPPVLRRPGLPSLLVHLLLPVRPRARGARTVALVPGVAAVVVVLGAVVAEAREVNQLPGPLVIWPEENQARTTTQLSVSFPVCEIQRAQRAPSLPSGAPSSASSTRSWARSGCEVVASSIRRYSAEVRKSGQALRPKRAAAPGGARAFR